MESDVDSTGITCGGEATFGMGSSGDCGVAFFVVGFVRVLRMPVCRFIRPFDVAGLGAKYLRIKSAFMNGMPSNWPLLIALIKVYAGGLKNA
eukprot:scaffold19184_cov46-Cyclotella_meneghiniana.AAC.15